MTTSERPTEARCLGCERCQYGKLYPCPSQRTYQPVPEWVRRAQAGNLPAKDLSRMG